MAPVLGYWKLRGLGQPIRLLLAHVDQEYEENSDLANWYDIKYTLGFDFPNLPYYVDGELKITQSGAIVRYLADKHNLNPSSSEEKRRVYEVEYQIIDFRTGLIDLVYNDNYEILKEVYIKKIPDSLKLFSNFLGKCMWLAGDTLTYVDFLFYETVQWHMIFSPGCVNEFPILKDYLTRFESLPNISKYIKSDKFIKAPLFGPNAKFNTVP